MNLLRPSRALARRCLWGAAIALCSVAAEAQDVDPNAVAVAFTGGDASGPPGVVNSVLLNVEITDDQIAASRDFRSMSLVVDIDCPRGRERLQKAQAFALPNLAGPPQPRGVSGEWATPESYMREVTKTICAMHGMRFVEPGATAGGNPPIARGPTSSAEPPPRPPAEPAFNSTPSPTPSPGRATDAAPAALTTASPRQSSSPAAAAGFLSQARVQVASSPSRADAEAKLGRSAALISPPLRGEVEVATVHGRTVYRSIIAPFSSQSEAQAFCARMRPSLDGCFVWRAR